MLTLPGTHQTCTWHSTGWQWPTPVSTPSSTTGWIKGILFIFSLSTPSYTTGWKVSNCSYCWLVLVLLLFGVFSNLIRRCGLQSPFNHQFCLTCMSRTSFGKYIDSYHWVKKWKRQIAVRFINLIANKKEKLSCTYNCPTDQISRLLQPSPLLLLALVKRRHQWAPWKHLH